MSFFTWRSLGKLETSFRKLNEGWNAGPNAPNPIIRVDKSNLELEFFANHFQFPEFAAGERLRLRFSDTWRYRLGEVNDEGWYKGQCRFSALAPEWGEFYEVMGDLKVKEDTEDWIYVASEMTRDTRHFLFYLRDNTFECDARSWELLRTV
jgi:hypothetical protein